MEDWMNYWKRKRDIFAERCQNEQEKVQNAIQNPFEKQVKVLFSMLDLNKNSEFGKKYHFSQINCIKDFKKNVPISDYDQYSQWIDKEIQSKGNTLSTSRILRFLKTSGTTGKSKAIPFTQYWMEESRTPALYALWGYYLKYYKELLDNPYSVLDLSTVRESVQDELNGIPYQSISNRNIIFNEKDWDPCWYEAPWFDESVPTDYDEKMYCRIRYFIGQDLRAIVSINPSTLVALYQNICTNKERLIQDILKGTLCDRQIAEPNEALANALKFTMKDNDFTMNDLWPKLEMLSCWTASSTELYLPKLHALYPKAKVLPYMACGSEGIVAIPVDEDLKAAPLAVGHAFYEFVPEETDYEEIQKHPENTLSYRELELGKNYHLIMSQANGIMRYMPGDIYKVTGFVGEVPKIEFVTRANTFFSFTGEKLTEEQILDAIEHTYEDLHMSSGLFFFSPVWDTLPYYELILEVSNEYLGRDEELKQIFDEYLRKVSYEFDSKRVSNRIGSTRIYPVMYGTVNAYLEEQKKKGNGVQLKYKPFMKENKMLEALLDNIEGRKVVS